MSKSGFSTLNRWLGRKNKDKSMSKGKLSKSSTNLSISSTNINETSQLEYNRITPLPAATTNAPFEQTFRITVLLPKDQLYVTRLGARVPLSKLLELVCDNKLLDEDKYEFRNPVDPSQVYSCDLTIGAVGLSEIRLCHKTESYDNFNSDEIIKLHRTSLIRESLSSSEFSSRNSKHTTKTTSPYSSTNSLNSMDSSAVGSNRFAKMQEPKMSAPPRKKRVAPKPPCQTAIPEKSPLIIENGHEEKPATILETSLATKDFSVSTPNLASSTLLHSDCNGNVEEDFNDVSSGNGSLNSHGYGEDTILYAQIQKKNALNLNSQNNKENLLVEAPSCKEVNANLPEPSPRKRIVQLKKKTAAPPAPPPRNSLYEEDAVSIASTNVSCNSAPSTPMALTQPTLARASSLEQQHQQSNEHIMITNNDNNNNNIPTPLPRITTSTTLLNITDIEQDLKHITSNGEDGKNKSNISKVMLNRTPTPEPRSLSCEPPEIEHCYETQLEPFKQQSPEEDCVSKQADSGIGEPVPSPLPDSLPSEVSNLDVKSHFESSSDDDDMVKVYNFKLGKTLVKPISETKTLEELTVMTNGQEETDNELNTPLVLSQVNTPNLSETSSWNFTIPISPPPNFADGKFIEDTVSDPKPDTPITPKITERPVVNFEDLKRDHEELQQEKDFKEIQNQKLPQSPTTPLDSILQELTNIIQEKGVDSLVKKPEEPQEIEAATPNTLSNFSIHVLAEPAKEVAVQDTPTNTQLTVAYFPKASSPLSSPSSAPEEEKLYRKRSSVTSLKQRRSITRSDSFHTTATPNEVVSCLNKRTSSQLSLDQMAGNLNSRRSSSELSIAESPSLQSLEIMKTILNSRKNSLAKSSSEEDKEIEVNARRPSEELKFASLELKTCRESLEKIEKEEYEAPDVQIQQETKNFQHDHKPKELPKVYRYSGPPSINFGTWSERPKSEVAIKNEGDYIFGGAKGHMDNNYRLSKPVAIAPKPAPKPAAIQRMGIPEKIYKVPILVRPLQDKVTDKVAEVAEEESQTKTITIQRPTVESVLRPQTQVIVNNSNNNALPRNMQRATSVGVESTIKAAGQSMVNTATLPRAANKQRFSTPAAVAAGPQLLRSASTKQQQANGYANGSEELVPGPQILRSSSSSINKVKDIEKVSTSNSPPANHLAPFGQNTLRRTGFKEKILLGEDIEKQTITADTAPIANGGLKLGTNAKLFLNLKPASITENAARSPKTPSPCCTSASITLERSTGVFQPKSAPVIGNNTFSTLYSSADDPRDTLLAAIRNFKKDALKKC